MMNKTVVVFFVLFAICSAAWASGDKEGNGGNGILIDGTVYVLDLVEAGVEKNPFYEYSIPVDPRILHEIEQHLKHFPEVHQKLAQKISEIAARDSGVAWALTESFRFFDIHTVSEPLIDLQDDDSLVTYKPGTLIQLAIRRGTTVYLNGKWWPQLSIDQKVALFLHEMVYSFQFSVYHSQLQKEIQKSAPARAIVGYLFSENLREKGMAGLDHLLYGESRLSLFNYGTVSSVYFGSRINSNNSTSSIYVEASVMTLGDCRPGTNQIKENSEKIFIHRLTSDIAINNYCELPKIKWMTLAQTKCFVKGLTVNIHSPAEGSVSGLGVTLDYASISYKSDRECVEKLSRIRSN